MPNTPDRISGGAPLPRWNSGSPSRSTARALAQMERRTLLRSVAVQAEGLVATEKTREVDSLARTAMGGQAMLRRWADTLAAGDPFLADELKSFVDLARLGKGQLIADLIDSYCREGRRW